MYLSLIKFSATESLTGTIKDMLVPFIAANPGFEPLLNEIWDMIRTAPGIRKIIVYGN